MCSKWFQPHAWDAWKVTQRLDHKVLTHYIQPTGTVEARMEKVGEILYQERQCKRCGYTEVTQIKVTL